MKYIITFALLTQILFCAPAFPGKRLFTQPDGTVVEYQNRGDEYLHWRESKDGDIILYNKDNARLEYAKIKDGHLMPSGTSYLPQVKTKRSSMKHLSKEDLQSLYLLKRKERSERMHQQHAH